MDRAFFLSALLLTPGIGMASDPPCEDDAARHDWFTEGFDTKDLQEAKALLEELT